MQFSFLLFHKKYIFCFRNLGGHLKQPVQGCTMTNVILGNFYINPRFDPNDVEWNLRITQKLPTLTHGVNRVEKNH